MGNRLSFGTKGTHEAEILQSPSSKDRVQTPKLIIQDSRLYP